jgi:NhaP-type Na+/H+ or K+/H+ antiporter
LPESVLLELASILVLGIAAQWVAARLRMPSILLLLAVGIVAGPVTGFLHPNALFGKLLLPGVSLAVAVILFEGGLSLQLRELREVGGAFIGLCTLGVLVTWGLATVAAWWLLGFPFALALLLGAILIVTGPTVIGPLIRHVHLTGRLGALLRWEGIVIDPIGALLAVLVFEGVLVGEIRKATAGAAVVLAKVSVVGGLIGLVAALLLLLALRRYWIPDHPRTPSP